jgi:hypothetical protein
VPVPDLALPTARAEFGRRQCDCPERRLTVRRGRPVWRSGRLHGANNEPRVHHALQRRVRRSCAGRLGPTAGRRAGGDPSASKGKTSIDNEASIYVLVPETVSGPLVPPNAAVFSLRVLDLECLFHLVITHRQHGVTTTGRFGLRAALADVPRWQFLPCLDAEQTRLPSYSRGLATTQAAVKGEL